MLEPPWGGVVLEVVGVVPPLSGVPTPVEVLVGEVVDDGAVLSVGVGAVDGAVRTAVPLCRTFAVAVGGVLRLAALIVETPTSAAPASDPPLAS